MLELTLDISIYENRIKIKLIVESNFEVSF